MPLEMSPSVGDSGPPAGWSPWGALGTRSMGSSAGSLFGFSPGRCAVDVGWQSENKTKNGGNQTERFKRV